VTCEGVERSEAKRSSCGVVSVCTAERLIGALTAQVGLQFVTPLRRMQAMQQIKVQRGIVCACHCADWLMGLLGPLSKHGKRSKNTRAPPA
jgi:hypothetical protein